MLRKERKPALLLRHLFAILYKDRKRRNNSICVLLFYFVNHGSLVYRRLDGPPRVIPRAAAVDWPGFLAVVGVFLASLDFPGRGSLVPSLRSSLLIICGLGMAFPDSYCPITCGFSLMAVANSFWVIFLAVRACMIALLRDLSTLAMVPTSVASSNCIFVEKMHRIQVSVVLRNSTISISSMGIGQEEHRGSFVRIYH